MSDSNLAFANGAANSKAPLDLIGALLRAAHLPGHPFHSLPASGRGRLVQPAASRFRAPVSPMVPKTAGEQLAQWAATDFPLLLQGAGIRDSYALALQIHQASARARRPFAAVNCALFSEDALELELFGYDVRTDFETRHIRPGVFERCNGGTVLLTEITVLPARLQARLLDVMDDRRLCRVGGDAWVEADTRVLVGPPANIQNALKAGTLRKELYYRLHAFAN
ncbi:MAG TPA: sigma 54-interacting transcriptional regulator [Terriglobia bacterium]|nr:sigma 54-interacting transcriptional regulator [Terriglobia bacterium]